MTSFIWPYDGNFVCLAGSFNDWQPQPLSKGPKGFQTTLDLAPGVYQYKFVIDRHRWCYDVLKPTVSDERGNKNNQVEVGGGAGKGSKKGAAATGAPHASQKQQQQHQQQAETSSPSSPVREAEPAEEKKGKGQQQQQQKGKGQQQQQQQQQQQKGKGQQQQQQEKKPKVSNVAKQESQKLVKTIKSYQVPFYVGDVDCEDSMDDVKTTADLVKAELPETGFMLVSGGTQRFMIAVVIPPNQVDKVTAIEVAHAAMSVVAEPTTTGDANFAVGEIAANPEKGIFPLKLKDLCRGPTFQLLRKTGLVKEDESEEEMYFMDE